MHDREVRRLQLGGIEVRRSDAEIRVGDKTYLAGSYVMLAGQAFRPYLVDLMEPQVYPELRSGTTGPTKRPYDVAGWTLPMQMGVRVERINDRFDTSALVAVSALPSAQWQLDSRDNSSYFELARMLQDSQKIGWSSDGKLVTSSYSYELHKPRVGLYVPLSDRRHPSVFARRAGHGLVLLVALCLRGHALPAVGTQWDRRQSATFECLIGRACPR